MKITPFFLALSLMLPCLEANGQEDFALQTQWFPIRQILWETYPFLTPCSPVVAIVNNDKGKFNLVNEQGKRLCKIDYDYIQPLSSTTGVISKRFFLVSSAEAQHVLDDKGNLLPLPDFQSCYYNSSLDVFILKQGDYYGMVDTKGRVKLPFQYTSLSGNAHHIVASTDGVHYGTISLKGKTRISPQLYKGMWPLPFGFLCVSNGDATAVLDSTGRQLCDFQFYDIRPLPSGGYFASLPEMPRDFRRYDKDFHLLDKDIWLLSQEENGSYIFCLPNKERCSMYRSDGSLIYEYADNNVNQHIKVNPYEPGEAAMAWAKQHSCTVLPNGCYNDMYGKRVLSPDKKMLFEYKEPIRYTLGGFFIQDRQTEEGLLDIHGKLILSFPYKRYYWGDGIMLVAGPDGYGQVRADGSFVLPATFQNLEVVMSNHTRWIRIKQNDRFGMADLEGNVLIPPKFNSIEFCLPNHWIVEKQDSAFVLDTKGQKIAQYGKDDCRLFIKKYIILKKNGQWGIQDAVGKELAPFIYDHISDEWDVVSFSDGAKTVTRFWDGSQFQDVGPGAVRERLTRPYPYVLLYERGKFGVYKRSGEAVLPIQYDQIINENENIKAVRQGNVCHLLDASFKPTSTFQADSLLGLVGKKLVFCIRSGQRSLVNPETGAARAANDQKAWIAGDAVWFYRGNSGLVLSLRTLQEILPFEVEVTSEYGQQVYLEGIYLFRKNGKAGLIDTSGTVLVPFEMDKILFYEHSKRFWLEKNGILYGIYHIPTRELALLNVEIKERLSNEGFILRKNNLIGYLNKDLEMSIPLLYQSLHRAGNNTFLATNAGLSGVVSENNDILIPFEYGSLTYNYESETWVGKKPVPTDIIRTDGTVYPIPSDHTVYQAKGSWAIISKGKNLQGDQLGLFSFKTGKMVLPTEYQSIRLYENDFAVISQISGNHQYGIKYQGLLDSLGRWVIPLDSLQLVSFAKEAIVAIDRQGRYGLFDWMGHLILPFEWESLSAVEDKPVIASKNGKYQMLRPDGTPLTRFLYDHIDYAWHNLYPVRRDKRWGYLNDQGEEVIPLQYLYAGNFGNGQIATVLTDSGYYAISGTGYKVKINYEDLQFPELKIYNEKVKPTCSNCVYDVWGRLLLTLDGVKLWGTANGLLVFSTDSTTSEPLKGVMDLSGKVICPPLYDEINLGNILHAFRKGKLWGYMDSGGVARIAPQFDMAGSFNSDRLATVKKDGRHFYINRKGECEKNCP